MSFDCLLTYTAGKSEAKLRIVSLELLTIGKVKNLVYFLLPQFASGSDFSNHDRVSEDNRAA